jgi:hypothetical protein
MKNLNILILLQFINEIKSKIKPDGFIYNTLIKMEKFIASTTIYPLRDWSLVEKEISDLYNADSELHSVWINIPLKGRENKDPNNYAKISFKNE